MRPIRLARIAAEAEGVRLRGLATRIATRVGFAIVALFFVLGAVVFLHAVAWFAIRSEFDLSPIATAAILGGVDLAIAIILGWLASRSSPSKVEVEAREVRRKALEGIGSALSLTQMVVPVLRLATGVGRRRRR